MQPLCRRQVGRKHRIPLAVGGVGKELLHRDTGVIDQYVDPSELFLDIPHHRFDRRAVADVRLNGDRFTAAGDQIVAKRKRFLFTFIVMDRDAIPFAGKVAGASRADPARRAGDQNRTHIKSSSTPTA